MLLAAPARSWSWSLTESVTNTVTNTTVRASFFRLRMQLHERTPHLYESQGPGELDIVDTLMFAPLDLIVPFDAIITCTCMYSTLLEYGNSRDPAFSATWHLARSKLHHRLLASLSTHYGAPLHSEIEGYYCIVFASPDLRSVVRSRDRSPGRPMMNPARRWA